jgi:hypothetical protein
MSRYLIIFVLITLLAICIFIMVGAQPTPAQISAKITPRLAYALSSVQKMNTKIQTIMILKDQFDIHALDQQLTAKKASPQERAYTVITSLQKHASRTQANLLNNLNSLAKNEVTSYQNFWIINAIIMESSANTIINLSSHPDVEYIDLPEKISLIEPVERRPASITLSNHAEPGLKVINADKLWRIGITGKGVIVGSFDDGVDGTHPALAASWRGNEPGVKSSSAWIDCEGSSFPNNPDEHGTGTTSIMVGLDTTTHDTIGVAFGAKWIAAKLWISHTLAIANGFLLSSFQWILDPDGFPETYDDMPIVVNNSWGYLHDCDSYLKPALDALEVAGIATIWAAGNDGSVPDAILAPQCLCTTDINPFSVGAVDGNIIDLPMAGFSSRGPTSCAGNGNQIKPEVVAPGNNVRHCLPGGKYYYGGGTSLSAPHVSGAIALLKQAFPNKNGAELKQLLYDTAVDLGEPGEDNAYGKGVIDVYAAYLANVVFDNPRAPIAVKAYSDYTMPTSVQLTWSDPAKYEDGNPLTNFDIVIRRDNQLIDNVASGIGSYTDNGLTDNQHYKYQIQSRDLTTESMSIPIEISVYAGGSPFPSQPDSLKYEYNNSHINLFWHDPVTQTDGTLLDDLEKIYIYRDSNLVDSVAAGVETYTDNESLPIGSVSKYYLRAIDNELPPKVSNASDTINCFIGNAPDYLVWPGRYPVAAASASADSIFEAIAANGESVFMSNNLFEFGTNLSIYKAIFIVLGVQNEEYYFTRTDAEPIALENYLINGGKIYLEGGVCFNLDLFPGYGWVLYDIKPWFSLVKGRINSDYIYRITGLFSFAQSSYIYNGRNFNMDELLPKKSTPVWKNDNGDGICGVWNNTFGSGLAIGVVPSFGGLVNYSNKFKNSTSSQKSSFITPAQEFLLQDKVQSEIFVNKYAYRPELKSNLKKGDHHYFTSDNGINIQVRTKTELMAAYLSLFEANPRYRADTVMTNSGYVIPGTGTLGIRSRIVNPESEQLSVQSYIETFDQSLKDTIPMFDDGLHNDSTAGDGLFGGSWLVPAGEKFYNIAVNTYSQNSGFSSVLTNVAKFTTIGPVIIDHYSITSTDKNPNAGDRLTYSFVLLNCSLSDTVKKIKTEIVPLDTFARAQYTRSYGDIPPGGTATSTGTHAITFLYGGVNTRFELKITSNGYFYWSDTFSVYVSAIEERTIQIPGSFYLFQNYPNPFNPNTIIEFSLPKTEWVTLKVFNTLGQQVTSLVSEKLNPGIHKYQWQAKNLPSGIYYCRLQAGEFEQVRKMILIR